MGMIQGVLKCFAWNPRLGHERAVQNPDGWGSHIAILSWLSWQDSAGPFCFLTARISFSNREISHFQRLVLDLFLNMKFMGLQVLSSTFCLFFPLFMRCSNVWKLGCIDRVCFSDLLGLLQLPWCNWVGGHWTWSRGAVWVRSKVMWCASYSCSCSGAARCVGVSTYRFSTRFYSALLCSVWFSVVCVARWCQHWKRWVCAVGQIFFNQ